MAAQDFCSFHSTRESLSGAVPAASAPAARTHLGDNQRLASLSAVQRKVQAGAEHVLMVLGVHAWGHNGAVVALPHAPGLGRATEEQHISFAAMCLAMLGI